MWRGWGSTFSEMWLRVTVHIESLRIRSGDYMYSIGLCIWILHLEIQSINLKGHLQGAAFLFTMCYVRMCYSLLCSSWSPFRSSWMDWAAEHSQWAGPHVVCTCVHADFVSEQYWNYIYMYIGTLDYCMFELKFVHMCMHHGPHTATEHCEVKTKWNINGIKCRQYSTVHWHYV